MAREALKTHFFATVGRAICEARAAANMRQTELVRRTQLDQNTISKAEQGDGCTLFTVALIAEALDVTLDELVPLDATSMPTDAAAE